MALVWISLWLVGGLLFFFYPRREDVRWAAAVCWFSGAGAMGVVLRESGEERWLKNIAEPAFSVAHYLAPFALVMFALHYAGYFKRGFLSKVSHIWKLILFLPPISMYLLYPIFPIFTTNYFILTCWVAPYVLIANSVLILCCWQSKNVSCFRERLVVALMVVPTTFFSLFTNYILKLFNIEEAWRFNVVAILFQSSAFLYGLVRFGVMGIRIHFEREHKRGIVEGALQVVPWMMHNIKNEVEKVRWFALKLESELDSLRLEEQKAWIVRILDVCEQLTATTRRYCDRIRGMETLEWEEEHFNLEELLRKVINELEPLMEGKKIKKEMKWDISDKVIVMGCKESLRHVVQNIICNSIEALQPGGTLTIELEQDMYGVRLKFKDNGHGIRSEDLARVTDPFFSTKRSVGHLGLGLSYCEAVMARHGGRLLVESRYGEGTMVTLFIPSKRCRRESSERYGIRRVGLVSRKAIE